jgi:hypothetical protein
LRQALAQRIEHQRVAGLERGVLELLASPGLALQRSMMRREVGSSAARALSRPRSTAMFSNCGSTCTVRREKSSTLRARLPRCLTMLSWSPSVEISAMVCGGFATSWAGAAKGSAIAAAASRFLSIDPSP